MLHDWTVISEETLLHPSVKVWQFSTIREGVIIGEGSVVGSCVYIGHNTTIGVRVRIQDKVHLTNHMVIEDNVFIGPCVVTMCDRYPWSGNAGYKAEGPIIRQYASIGAGAILLPGVTIGAGAMVGSGAVVTKDVIPGTTVVGNPAKVIRSEEWGHEMTKALRQAEEDRVEMLKVAYGFDPKVVTG